MLEGWTGEETSIAVCRLAAMPRNEPRAILLQRGIYPVNVADTIAAIEGVGIALGIEEMIDNAFRPRMDKPKPFQEGRFGDGMIGVYYSAIEETTCEKEIAFHQKGVFVELGYESFQHPRFYSLIDCRFSGFIVELRGMEEKHPELTSETERGYPFCQRLGRQAVENNVEGFLAPSARNRGGTCVPVFTRRALTEAGIRYRIVLTVTPNGAEFQRQL